MHSSGGINIAFPKKYNVGTTAGADATGQTMMNLEATKEVKIHVHGANKAGQYVFIDYLFETAGFNDGSYFMYDPDVTEVAKAVASSPSPLPVTTPSSDLGAATMPASTSFAFAVALVGAFSTAFLG